MDIITYLSEFGLNFGIPAKFLTDNRTVFIYNGLKPKSLEKDTLTQFGYACQTLGVELETTSIPEKKAVLNGSGVHFNAAFPLN